MDIKKDNTITAQVTHSLPNAKEIEESVLAALITDYRAFSKIERLYSPDVFFDEKHRHIAIAIKSLRDQMVAIDMLTVVQTLKINGVLDAIGGPMALVDISMKVASGQHIESHYGFLHALWRRREIYAAGSKMMQLAVSPEWDDEAAIETCEKIASATFESGAGAGGDIRSSMQVVMELEEEENRILSLKEGEFTGIPSGLDALDRKTQGFQNSDLIVIAARPGMGKTALADTICKNIGITQGIPIALFTLEMSALQQQRRIISALSGIPLHAIKDPRKIQSDGAKEAYRIAKEKAASGKIQFMDTPINLSDFRSSVRYCVRELGCQIIVVDYLQLIQNTGNNKIREQEVGEVSRTLKNLAKELTVPVIALSQLSRAVETRGGSKRPQMSDLRESGSIEQDADLVIMLYRPEYYDILETEDGQSTVGIMELIFAKARDMSPENVTLKFDGNTTSVSDIDTGNSFNVEYDDITKMLPKEKNWETDIPF